MGRRGIATTVAYAAAVLLILVAMALLLIFRTYIYYYASIAEYAYASEHPKFTVRSLSVTSGGVQAVIENDGGVPVLVKAAYVFVYNGNTVAGTVPCANVSNLYVPPSASFTCTVHVSNVLSVLAPDRPFEVVVLTDRGPALAGAMPPTGSVVIDVVMPGWLTSLVQQTPWDVGEFTVSLSCPGAHYTFDVRYNMNATSQNDRYVLVGNLMAVGSCNATLTYQGPYRVLLGQFSSSLSPAGTEEYEATTVQMSQSVGLEAGKSVAITFTMPDFLTSATNVQSPAQQPTPIIYDFSWYFYPALTVSSPNVYGTNGSNVYIVGIYNVTQDLIKSGVIDVSSPAGCAINTESAYQAFLLGTKTFWAGSSIPYSIDNGVPLVASCNGVASGSEVLSVSVPFTVPVSGSYVVIPVLTAYVGNPNNNLWPYNVNVAVSASLSGPTQVPGPRLTGGPPLQYAEPFVGGKVYLQAGQYNLVVNMYVDNRISGEVIAAIVLSKLILIPVTSAPAFCEFAVDNLPTLPYAVVNLQTETVTRTAPIILNYAISSSYFHSTSQWQNYSFLFYNSTSKEVVLRELYVAYNDVKLFGLNENFTENLLGENAVPYYVAPSVQPPWWEWWVQPVSYSVAISAKVNSNYTFDEEDLGGLYAYSGAYAPYPGNLYPQLSANGVAYQYQGLITESQAWAFVLDYGVPSGTPPTANMTINVTAQSGDYIVLGLMFGIAGTPSVPPTISVSGGQIVYEPNLATLFIGGANFNETPIIIEMESSTVSITISPPLDSGGNGIVGLVNLAVYNQPLPWWDYTVVSQTGMSAPVGIDLENVRSPTGTVNVYLYDLDSGALLAKWTINNAPQYATNYVLSIDGFANGPYYDPWQGYLPYLQQEVPYLLVIYGAYCGSG